MAKFDRHANEFLSSALLAANYVEFHWRVGRVLEQYDEGELLALDALGRIRHLHELLTRYNSGLRAHRQLPPK
ncbi:MAG: hypothetical protein JSU86_17935 [Phycisphaerales bacterium]|nr:MAG: hypothetical protein JSU86_17935 [Phycisphaerales bacterium]